MNVYAPDVIEPGKASETDVLANIFAGSERSKVEMRLGEKGAWMPMAQVEIEDPEFVRLQKLEAGVQNHPTKPIREVIPSAHIWKCSLPPNTPAGTHTIHVRTTDMFGQTYTGGRIVTVQ